VGIVVGIT